NFKNNTINQATTSGKPTYGLQLTSDYGNNNLVINGEGNVINKRGADDALYVWELGTGTSNGYVDIATITLNATDGVFYVLDGDTFAIGISSVEELKEFAAEVNAGNNFAGKNIVLLNDIDLVNAAWTPIGNGSKAFKGNFNGLNHTIKNLNIVATSAYAGLFGYTFGGNLIENLVIENINATGTGYLGGVAGFAETTSFKNITIQGDVFIDCSGQDIGALTGYTYGTLTDITVNVNEGSYVKGHSYFGGVVGYRGEGAITYTRVKSNIDVIGKAYMIGGITGMAQYGNKFVDCECSGNVSLTEGDPTSANRWMRIGGIAGSWMDGNDTYVVTLENCAFTGTLSSKNTDGDYVTEFDHNGYVGRSYNTSNKGKLIINGVESVEPIFIATAEKLVAFAESVNAGNTYAGKKVVISKDIDLEGIEWTPIGTSTRNMFAGEFDGKGHSIKNLSVKRVERYGNGFFGNLSGKAVIKNITFDNAYVGNGDSQFNGNMYAIVAGYIYGSGYFENVHVVNSEVHGYGKVAAFVGQVADPGAHTMTIKNCSVEDTDIYGVYNVAKLVGLVQRGVSVVVENTDVSSAKFVKADGEIYEDIVDATVTEATSGDTMVVSGNFWVYGEYLYAGFAEHYCDYEVGHLDYRFEDGRYYCHGTTH
ncbi:MAG: hypothetical protein UHY58_03970, partial [Alistipes sp.]|nr:hypothetical protein [Alistipes sp.]